jgi:uncharacterized protein YkwD
VAAGSCALILALVSSTPALADSKTVSNNEPIGICIDENGTPFPSTIDVSGVSGNLTAVTAGLGGFTTGSTDTDFVLQSPTGKTVLIMSDVQSEGPVDLTFDDAAPGEIPALAPSSGTYKPTDIDSGGSSDALTPPGPAAPYGTTMSALNGDSPNGTWKLFVAQNPTAGMPCTGDGSVANWSLNLTTADPPPPAPDPQPQPEPAPNQPPADPNAPQIQSAAFDSPLVAGQDANLHVVARDADSPVTGLIVDFGETLGLFAESACQTGQKNEGGTVAFDIPYRYLSPGTHTLTLTILSGGCGEAQATQTTQTVTVAAAAFRAFFRAQTADTLAGPPITSKCKNATMSPARAQTKAIVKALLCVMNEQRKLFKLKPLKSSKKLAKAAVAHSRSMVLGSFFAHQGPSEAALPARLRKVKYRGSAGENIGAGAGVLGSPLKMVDGWMHSTLHRANLLSKRWRAVGIGFLAQYPLKTAAQPVATYTTDFGPKP